MASPVHSSLIPSASDSDWDAPLITLITVAFRLRRPPRHLLRPLLRPPLLPPRHSPLVRTGGAVDQITRQRVRWMRHSDDCRAFALGTPSEQYAPCSLTRRESL